MVAKQRKKRRIVFRWILLPLILILSGIKLTLELKNQQFEYMMNNFNWPDTTITTHVDHKTITADDFNFHYFVSGPEKAPALILFPPAFADHSIFNEQLEAFSEKFRVIAVDLIGHGLSQSVNGETIDQSSFYINAILEQEGINEAHLLGISVGSLIAQYFAYEYPGKVASLTAVGGYRIHQKNSTIQSSQRKSQFQLIWRAIFSMKTFRTYAAEISTSTEKGRYLFYKSCAHFTRRSFRAMQGLSNVVQHREVAPPTYPQLMMVGEYDVELAHNQARAFYEFHPENASFVTVKDAGHCVNIDQTAIFNQIILNFLLNIEKTNHYD